jgi:hypothetical protein
MIRLGKQEEVDEYFNRSEASQSFLKALCKGVSFTNRDEKEAYYEEKGHLIIGSAVDDKISMGNEAFEKKYHVSTIVKPSDAIMSIVQMIFDGVVSLSGSFPKENLHGFPGEVLEAADFHNYQSRWKEETRVNKIMEMGFTYFEELRAAYGKQILSDTENKIVLAIEMSWRTNSYTREYFNGQEKHIHIFYQVPIYFEVMNIDCKCLLDVVIVNTINKTIQPIDFKTMGENPIMFPKSVARFGYSFQGAFYTEGLQQLVVHPETTKTLPELAELIMANGGEDIKVLPFKFMTETTNVKIHKLTGEKQFLQGNPLMYTLSEEQIRFGKYGRPELFYVTNDREGNPSSYELQSKEVLGFIQALDLVVWHSLNGFEKDMKVVEANGDILI